MTSSRFFSATPQGKKLLGEFRLEDGHVASRPLIGNELLFRRISVESVLVDGKGRRVTAAEDPELWIKSLPFMYHGSYLWAEAE